MYLRLLCVLVIVVVATNGSFVRRKPGTCPNFPDVGICDMTCYGDAHCPGARKCCRTACGGSFCTNPASRRVIPDNENIERPGSCPNPPSGPWVCSSRCSGDSDCREGKKCCKNRCGAFACVKSEIRNNEIY